MARDRLPPEGERGQVAPRDGGFPRAGIAAEDGMRGGGAHAAAPMLPHDEELGHVAVHGHAAMRVIVEEREADQHALAPEQERNAGRVRPVGIEMRVGRKAPVILQLAIRHSSPVFGEVVNIELHQIGEHGLFVRPRGSDVDGGHGGSVQEEKDRTSIPSMFLSRFSRSLRNRHPARAKAPKDRRRSRSGARCGPGRSSMPVSFAPHMSPVARLAGSV